MLCKIYEVNEVLLQINKTNPPFLSIIAIGTVSSTGWTNSRLVPFIYIAPPKDGIYEFDFVAETPTGTALDVLMPISTAGEWHEYPKDLKGIRVYASSNEKTIMLEGSKELQPHGGGGAPHGLYLEGGGSGNPK